MVYDFGGGTLDVTVIQILRKKVTVKAINGDNQLGGQDLDIEMVKWAIEQYNKENTTEPLLFNNQRAMARLRKACSEAKDLLANADSAIIDVDNIIRGNDLDLEISRAIFEDICQPYFDRCMIPVIKSLKEANITKD